MHCKKQSNRLDRLRYITLILLFQGQAMGQGTINFNNGALDAVDAQIFDLQVGADLLRGPDFLAQLYVGPAGSSEKDLRPVAEAPVPFRYGAASGFLDVAPNPIRAIPGIPPDMPGVAQIRAWTANSGNTFEEAVALAESSKEFRHRYGVSPLVHIPHLGGSDPSNPPANLIGLKRFAIRPAPYTLSVTQSSNSLIFSWPAAETNYVLETSSNLSQTSWGPVQAPAVVQGGTRWSTNPISAQQGFFRLKRY